MNSRETKRVIFWGTPEFAIPTLDALAVRGWISAVITKPAKPKGRGKKDLQLCPVGKRAEKYNVPVLTPDRLSSSLCTELQRFLPATFVVVAYGKIIPDEILKLSTPGVVNVHPSLLPELRGPSPIQSAILDGRLKTGVTLIELDSEMDHGPIIVQSEVMVHADDTYESLSARLAEQSASLVTQTLPDYMRGAIVLQSQKHDQATYCKRIEAQDGLLDLTTEAPLLLRKIRALNPWPGAHILWNGMRLEIISANIVTQKLTTPFGVGLDGKLLIACGNNSVLEAHTVQLAGKKIIASEDFVRGQKYFHQIKSAR